MASDPFVCVADTAEPQKCLTVPEEYYERVEDMHENGGFGSIGCVWGWFLGITLAQYV